MKFRRHQEASRANTTRLLFLFMLLLGAVVFLVDRSIQFIWQMGFPGVLQPEYLRAGSIAITALVILCGAGIESYRLSRGGGVRVAKSLDGREVSIKEPRNSNEQRLLKIVYEMCVAARIDQMPKVYVFDDQMGINAFVAGWSNKELVVCVTEGLLLRLNREETQGVIAHEFGHIINEDVRLNMQLIACVYGLEMIHELGSILMQWRSGSRSGKSSVSSIVPLVGITLLLIGYIGMLAGKILQAAILRQREYLADACAIQFTRNPHGLGGALRKIDQLEALKENEFSHSHSLAVSHLFIAKSGSGVFSMMNSHPHVKSRISRIFDGKEPAASHQNSINDDHSS